MEETKEIKLNKKEALILWECLAHKIKDTQKLIENNQEYLSKLLIEDVKVLEKLQRKIMGVDESWDN